MLDVQKQMQDDWKEAKGTMQFSPDKFSYQNKETTQTAHATIGNGEIIIRNDPNASLNGLNRDPSQSVTEETTANVNIKLDPLFTYVDAGIALKNVPSVIDNILEFKHDPPTYLAKAWDIFVKKLPWTEKENVNANKSPSASSSPSPQAAPEGK